MKAKLIIGFIVVAVAATAGWNISKDLSKMQISELALANIEALAQNEGDSGVVIKDCYTAFSGYDGGYYATCSQYSSDASVSYPCGAVTSEKPAWGVTLIGKCYQYI